MRRRYKIFISSTYSDLVEERLQAVLAILKMGHIPVGMELFIAGRPSIDIIEDAINDCDIYVLICGKVYGSIYRDKKSYTEYEYEYAQSIGKPRFSVVLKLPSENEAEYHQQAFRKKVLMEQCEFFTSTSELTSSLNACLHQLITQYHQSMNGYLEYKEIYDYKNLKMFVFQKDMSTYKSILGILSYFDNRLDAVLTDILSHNICEKALEVIEQQFNTLKVEVFIQENMNEIFNKIITSLRMIVVQKKNSQFLTPNMDEDIVSINHETVQKLISSVQELKEIIRDQGYYHMINCDGGDFSV